MKKSMRLLVAMVLLSPHTTRAELVTPGNIVSLSSISGGVVAIQEFDANGSVVQSLNLVQPPKQTGLLTGRDLAIGPDGWIYIYSGTFDPYLSAYDPVKNHWSHTTTPGWNSVGNVTFGGLAILNDTVYMTDMVGGVGSGSGILAYHIPNGSFTRFASGSNPQDLNVGLDGKLYAINDGSSSVQVYDPATLALLDTVFLGASGIRTIAADGSGNIYAATWNSILYKYDATGMLLASLALTGQAVDLDISASGMVLVGTRLDGLFLTDTEFSSFSSIAAAGSNHFVSFAPVPLPASVWMLLSAVAGLICPRLRSKAPYTNLSD